MDGLESMTPGNNREQLVFRSMPDRARQDGIDLLRYLSRSPVTVKYSVSYIVAIAVDDYTDPRFSRLEKAVSDAEKVVSAFIQHGFKVYRKLYNAHATKTSVLKCFDDLALDLPKDKTNIRVVFYIGCHGYKHIFMGPDRMPRQVAYFAFHDTIKNLPNCTALAMDSLRSCAMSIPAEHQLYIVDSCYAGDALHRSRGPYVSSLVDRQCCVLLCSSSAGQKAIEDQHGSPFARALVTELTSPGLFEHPTAGCREYVPLESIVENIRRRTYDTSAQHNFSQIAVYGALLPHNEGSFIFFSDDFKPTKEADIESNASYVRPSTS